MLTSLTIKNYALIESLQVDFKDSFTTITGETGAGKSVLLGGLSLILGKRADINNIRDKDKNCIVEATFDIGDYKLESVFEDYDLDYDKNTIIRRVILPSGKSRAFVNDSPVKLSQLQSIGSYLIDIHSQHDTLLLTGDAYQFKVIDALAKTNYDLEQYQTNLVKYKKINKELDELNQLKIAAARESGYNSFLLEELNEAKITEGEFEKVEEEYETLNNVEAIQERLAESFKLMSDEQIGILPALKKVKNSLEKLSTIGNKYQNVSERLNSVYIEMDDIFSEVESLQGHVEDNPQRLEELNKRLSLLNGLMHKHQARDTATLIALRDELQEKVVSTENVDESIKKKEFELEKIESDLNLWAETMRNKRKVSIPELKTKLELMLVELGMPNAQFSINITPEDTYFENGKDKLTFKFTANKGEEFKELKKAASGGELSRIMLAIKSIISENIKLPTIMFDEIDTGVSGEISNKMAEIMMKMSKKMQVFTITHLPQVAAKGKSQLKVFKEDIDNKTTTKLTKLKHDERVQEIAQMLGGEKPSDSALAHAIQLLN